MTDRTKWGRFGLLAAVLAGWSSPAAGQATGGPAAPGVVVLDTTGFWRLHHTLKPPVIQADGGLKPLLLPQAWLNAETPEPPGDWTRTDFDDANWVRGPARLAVKSAYLARLCMRGKFMVTDPARVKGLSLSVTYQGGIVVYLNGQEVKRAHLPAGSPVAADSAEAYPLEAYVDSKGQLSPGRDVRDAKIDPERARRYQLRERSLDDVAIPSNLLRKGLNVLAVETVRAPYPQTIEERKQTTGYNASRGIIYDTCFNTCEFVQAQLTAAGADGLVANATRPQGLQVWNSSLLCSDYDMDWGDPCEKLQPVFILAARNGSFSGKVVVGSTKPIEGLKATPGELKGPGTIPASAVRVRYALPWGREGGLWGFMFGVNDNKHWRYPRQADLLEALDETPPGVAAVRPHAPGRFDLKTPNQPEPVFGAVVPVWITVTVPPDAAPGLYEGRLTIQAAGSPPVPVTVRLEVVDFRLPDPQDYRTIVELVQSPDTLAVEYDAPLWSPKHWDLLARSLRLLDEVGSRTLYVPLIAQTNLGNEQSMVRWIDKGGGKFEFDFSVMDRYLDAAVKHMGKPKVIILGVWEVYMIRPDKARARSEHDEEMRMVRYLQQKRVEIGSGPVVTMVDGGAVGPAALPHYDGNAVPRQAWASLFQQIRQRLAARGLDKTPLLGDMSDAWPTREEAAFLKDVSGDLAWSSFSHINVPKFRMHDVADVGYSGVNSVGRYAAEDRKGAFSLFGWRRPERYSLYNRDPGLQEQPMTRWRHFTEACITGDLRGMVRIGGDFWPAVKDRSGRRIGTVADRYPQSTRRNLNIYTSLLAPGPDGPLATTRLEAFREGVMDCEARIILEEALTDESIRARLPADLLQQIRHALEHRTRTFFKGMSTLQLSGPAHTYAITWKYFPVVDGNTWYIGSGWQDRSRTLFALAGQVQKALAAAK